MRTQLVLGNWKMNLSARQAVQLARDLKRGLASREGLAEVGVCPSPVHTAPVREALDGSSAMVGGQDLVSQPPGAFTGGTSAEQLKDLGLKFTLVGHSERRQFYGETDEDVAAKTKAAQRVGLRPVVCFGETLEEREAGQTEAVCLRQVDVALAGQSAADVAALVLAYEPVWAIGTGRNAEVSDAHAVHHRVRAQLESNWGAETAAACRIVYGGSVKPANAAEYFADPDIDGALVGGASLDADSFLAILDAVRPV